MKQKSLTQIFIILTLMLAVIVLSSGCAKDAAKPTLETQAVSEEAATPSTETQAVSLELTLDQLRIYNGKNGKASYVAVYGIIYDVSALGPWKNGEHNGFKAGNDLTKEIKASPHGISALKGVPVVGKIIT